MNTKGFKEGVMDYVALLNREGRFSTAKSYQDAWNSFVRFNRKSDISYTHVTRDVLRQYENFLLRKGCMRNTISTYMRRLRSIYNLAVDNGDAPYVPHLFHDVFTGIESKRKKSLTAHDLHKLMTVPVRKNHLRKVQLTICLMFQYGGMPFADFAHLKAENMKQDQLVYYRKKTGTPIRLALSKRSQKMAHELTEGTLATSPYLFSYLTGDKEGKDAYKEYRKTLQQFNRHLKTLAKCARIHAPVTSYSIRHSFANLLKEQHIPIEVISELLGHQSIRTTQVYLRSFSLEKLKEITESCFWKVYQGKK